MQLDYAIEGYWLAKRRDFSANTINDYTLTFKRLTEFVGKTRELKDISGEDIKRFLNTLRDDLELSQKTILNHWIALSSFWTWVERDLGLPHIIRGKVNRPRPRRRLSAAYTEAEIRELLAACDRGAGWDRAHGQRMEVKRPSALRDRALILVLLDTGIRASELTALVSERTTSRRSRPGHDLPGHHRTQSFRVLEPLGNPRRRIGGSGAIDRGQGFLLRPHRLRIGVQGGGRHMGQGEGPQIGISARGKVGTRRHRQQLAVTHVQHSPRRPTPAPGQSRRCMYRGSSAFPPDTTCVATGNPSGSRVAKTTLTCGRSGRWSLLCPN